MELQFMVSKVRIEPDSGYEIGVTVEGADGDQILGHFKLKDIVDFFGADDLLDQIGLPEAMEHFDLQEKQ